MKMYTKHTRCLSCDHTDLLDIRLTFHTSTPLHSVIKGLCRHKTSGKTNDNAAQTDYLQSWTTTVNGRMQSEDKQAMSNAYLRLLLILSQLSETNVS